MVKRILRGLDRLLPPPTALVVASVGAAISGFVVVSTLASSGPIVPTWTVVVLFFGLFPIHFRSVRLLLPDRDLKKRLLVAPRLLLAVAAIAGAVTFAFVVHGILTIHGQPERHNGGYFVDDHGDLRRVSRGRYRYTQRLEQRIFGGGALLFYLVSVLINAGELRLTASAGSRDRSSTWPGRASAT
jgi:hypothetical protein